MQKLTKVAAALALSISLTPRAEAQSGTVDFEAMYSASNLYPTIGNYLGLDFTSFWGLNATAFRSLHGGGYRAVSGDMVAFSRGESRFRSSTEFFLGSLWIGSGWEDSYPLSVSGYRGGQKQWERFLNGKLTGATKIDLSGAQDQGLIDEVRFNSSGYEYYIDDVQILNEAHATPEPVTMALLATGLAGVGGAGAFRRRRKDTES